MRFGLALGLGLLIGLEREYTKTGEEQHRAAGLRTHALVALLGAAAAYLGDLAGVTVLAAVMLGYGALVVASYVLSVEPEQDRHLGTTSEVVALLTFVLGALAYRGAGSVAGAVAVTAAVVLSAKLKMHGFVRALSTDDIVAVLKFAVVTFIVLPLLPNREYGPLGAFNPHKTWLMVVLIGGIGFAGYALSKVVGTGRGIPLTGLIGGLVSSTAVTLANARRSQTQPELSSTLALGVILACTVMLPRLCVAIAVVHAPLLAAVGPPLGAMLIVSLVFCAVLYRRLQGEQAGPSGETAAHANPFELGEALKFAGIFAVVTFLVKWANHLGAGQGGVYAVSALSGLADTDAITVSLASQAKSGFAATLAARGIVIGAVSNTLLKGSMAFALGSRELGRLVLACLGLTAVVGVTVAFLVA